MTDADAQSLVARLRMGLLWAHARCATDSPTTKEVRTTAEQIALFLDGKPSQIDGYVPNEWDAERRWLTRVPPPATPVIDETRRLVAEWDGNNIATPAWLNAECVLGNGIVFRLRSILAEHDAVAARRCGGWRDIASAPKDGSDILAYCSDSREMFVVFWHIGNGWQYAVDPVLDRAATCLPTHWMPLTAPPTENEEDRG